MNIYIYIYRDGHWTKEVTSDLNTGSSQGIVIPMSWLNPYSSSALSSSRWNWGCLNHEIGTMYRLLFSPTYTAKCPLGTSSGRPSSPTSNQLDGLLRMLEHFFRICFSAAACGILMAISWELFPTFGFPFSGNLNQGLRNKWERLWKGLRKYSFSVLKVRRNGGMRRAIYGWRGDGTTAFERSKEEHECQPLVNSSLILFHIKASDPKSCPKERC